MPPSTIVDADYETDEGGYYALEKTGLWRWDSAGTWTQVLIAASLTALGLTGVEFCRVRVQGGWVYVIGIGGGSSPYSVYVFRSQTKGISWSYSLVGENIVTEIPYTVTSVEYSVTVSPPSPGVWTSAAVSKVVERKGDSNNTYNPWAWAFQSSTPSGNFSMLSDDGTLYQGPPTPYANMEQVQSRHPGAVIGDCNKLLPVGMRPAALAMLDDYFGLENTGWFKFGLTNYGTLAFPLDPARNRLSIQANSPDATTDAGVFWYFWNTPQKAYPLGFDVAKLNSQWLYLGLEDKILQSQDGGFTWQIFTDQHGADDIRIHPLAAGCIAFWGEDGNLYQCVDGVMQPTLLSAGVRVKQPLRIAYSPNGGDLYALSPTAEEVFNLKRRSLGVWSDLETGATGARAIRCYPNGSGQRLFYLNATNIRYSDDSGATWADRKGNWSGYGRPVNIHLRG